MSFINWLSNGWLVEHTTSDHEISNLLGVADRDHEDFDFYQRLQELNEELEMLNVEAWELEEQIAENVAVLLEGA